MYRCNKKVLYDLPEVFDDFLRAYAGLLVKVYKDSGVCLSRARTKTTMNAFRGTFLCISHSSRSRGIFFWLIFLKLKTVSSVLYQPRKKLKKRLHKRNPVFGASAQRISRPSYTAVVALTATCENVLAESLNPYNSFFGREVRRTYRGNVGIKHR